jgi:DNA-binding protein H-NS
MEKGRLTAAFLMSMTFNNDNNASACLIDSRAGQMMRPDDFQSMSIDELWALREEIGKTLAAKLETEKRELEALIEKLGRETAPSPEARQRRPYPKVYPKFQNPAKPAQTWAGRGRQPRWMSELLAAGKSIDELRIAERA